MILGRTGVNFGAGMTGGTAFVYDVKHEFWIYQPGLIEVRRIDTEDTDIERYYLKKLLKDYYNETKSPRPSRSWTTSGGDSQLLAVRPNPYARPLKMIEEGE